MAHYRTNQLFVWLPLVRVLPTSSGLYFTVPPILLFMKRDDHQGLSMPLLFLLFLGVPLLELYLLIQIGSNIGALTTILLVVFTASLGAVFIRIQGISTLTRLQQQLSTGNMPGQEIVDAAALLIAGILLLTPGFFTDTLGFLLLIPALRRWVFKDLIKRFFVAVPGSTQKKSATIRIVEAERLNDE